MLSETLRPDTFENVLGHVEPKARIEAYLTTKPYVGAVCLVGPPGIGKTTLALAACRTFGFDALEINASKSIRSFRDVDALKDACRSAVNIHAFMRHGTAKTTCVVLDEVDGSDPHAQRKIVEWMRDPDRRVPILCTGNDVPIVFKRNADVVQVVRCYPPRATEFAKLFPGADIQSLWKECQHDVRRVCHRIQYGASDVLPKYVIPPTGLPIEDAFIRHQAMFSLPDPYARRDDTRDTGRS